jgi:hypothetical protein
MDGLGWEHEESAFSEVRIDVAAEDFRKKSGGNGGRTAYSLFRLPGTIPVVTVWSSPAICHAADPPFE